MEPGVLAERQLATCQVSNYAESCLQPLDFVRFPSRILGIVTGFPASFNQVSDAPRASRTSRFGKTGERQFLQVAGHWNICTKGW